MKNLSELINEHASNFGAESVSTRLDVNELIKLLNKALAEEELASYQYWIAVGLLQGKSRTKLEMEFNQHADDERDHDLKVKNRIIELGGIPVLSPMEWNDIADCKYDIPVEPFDCEVLCQQNVAAEQCAIKRYQEIIDFCGFDKDPVTRRMAEEILKDEQGHLQDLTDFQRDWYIKNNE